METQQAKLVVPRLRKDGKYSWVICFSCAAIFMVTFGILKSTGVIFVRLYQSFNMSKSEAVNITVIMFASPLISRTGIGILNIAALSVLSGFFRVHLGKATGIILTGAGIGGFVFPPLVEYMDEIYGLSNTFLLLSGFILNLCVANCLIINPPEDFTDAGNVNAPSANERNNVQNDFHAHYGSGLQNLEVGKSVAFVDHSMALDDEVICDSTKESTAKLIKNIEALEQNKESNQEAVSKPRKLFPCFITPRIRKSLCLFLQEDLAIIKTKYCIAVGLAFVPMYLSILLASITFPEIAVNLEYSLAKGAMLISIAAVMEIVSQLTAGVVLDARCISLGFTFGCPLFCMGLCMILMGILEKSASYGAMAAISAAFGFLNGFTGTHLNTVASRYLGSKSVPTVIGFSSFLTIVPTFLLSALIDYFLTNFHQYAYVLYIDGVLFILSSIFWIMSGVKETRLKNTS